MACFARFYINIYINYFNCDTPYIVTDYCAKFYIDNAYCAKFYIEESLQLVQPTVLDSTFH